MARRNRSIDTFELAHVSMTSGPAAAAARGRELLASGQLPEDTTRVELMAELADYLIMTREYEEAEGVLREALTDGGRAFADVRILLAEVVSLRGDRDQAEQLLAAVRADRPTHATDYRTAAELLEAWGDHAGALRWVNTGAFRTMRLDEDLTADQIELLIVRRRMRLEMGFTEDEYDLLAAEESAARRRVLEDDGFG